VNYLTFDAGINSYLISEAKNESYCVDKNPNDNILLFSRENLPPYKGAKNQDGKAKQTQFKSNFDSKFRVAKSKKPKFTLGCAYLLFCRGANPIYVVCDCMQICRKNPSFGIYTLSLRMFGKYNVKQS